MTIRTYLARPGGPLSSWFAQALWLAEVLDRAEPGSGAERGGESHSSTSARAHIPSEARMTWSLGLWGISSVGGSASGGAGAGLVRHVFDLGNKIGQIWCFGDDRHSTGGWSGLAKPG